VTALVVGTVLALLALGFVLYPIFVDESRPTSRLRRAGAAVDAPTRDGAIAALREIEFDRATGKLSDADYAALKASYTREALAAMRAEESAQVVEAERQDGAANASPTLDIAEAAIQKARRRTPTCATCGLRPEPDAVYCSTCGSYLAGACGACGAVVAGAGARFCTACGHTLAA
jgi:hypothetical protein